MNLNKYLSINKITFLKDVDKSIVLDKSGGSKYYQMFNIALDEITNFIRNLDKNEIYLVNPCLSINCKNNNPSLNLSPQFLVSRYSNARLIWVYLTFKLEVANKEFKTDFTNDGYYFLIFKYKMIKIDYKDI